MLDIDVFTYFLELKKGNITGLSFFIPSEFATKVALLSYRYFLHSSYDVLPKATPSLSFAAKAVVPG